MSIQKGDRFPSITLKRLAEEGMTAFDTSEMLKGKKVVLFGVPGAFTPTCSQKHLPGYIAAADSLKNQGVDAIICMSVNDPFVMRAWAQSLDPTGTVEIWPDGNAELTKALGLEFDASGNGLGTRCKRFSMVIQDGVVEDMHVESKPGELMVSGADSCLKAA